MICDVRNSIGIDCDRYSSANLTSLFNNIHKPVISLLGDVVDVKFAGGSVKTDMGNLRVINSQVPFVTTRRGIDCLNSPSGPVLTGNLMHPISLVQDPQFTLSVYCQSISTSDCSDIIDCTNMPIFVISRCNSKSLQGVVHISDVRYAIEIDDHIRIGPNITLINPFSLPSASRPQGVPEPTAAHIRNTHRVCWSDGDRRITNPAISILDSLRMPTISVAIYVSSYESIASKV